MSGPELATEAHGAGMPAIIQPPAWGPSSDYLRRGLVPLLEGLRTVTYDARNTGGSSGVEGEPVTLDDLVDDLDSVRARHGFERFLLLGHSHGGWVAMAYGVRHPGRLLGLALLNTALRPPELTDEAEAILQSYENDPRRERALRLYREAPRGSGDIDTDRELGDWIRLTMPVLFRDLDAMRRFQSGLVGTPLPSVAALRAAPRMGDAAWVREGLSEVDVPALVVAGRHDPTTPPSQAEEVVDRLPRARLVVFEDSGHNPWVEEPRRFGRVMGRFVREVRFAASPPVG